LASRRRVWLPPVIFTIVIFVVAIFLSQGKDTLGFVYRFF
jgi:hypothetical protein